MLSALETYKLTSTYERVNAPTAFLQERYFNETQVYDADKALAEFMSRSRRIAPFCIARHNGIPVERGTYDIETYESPLISLKRSLTADDLERKGFGEALYNQYSPERRQDIMLLDDAYELDTMITRTEEKMCADIMLTNSVTCKAYADDLDDSKSETTTINFYSEVSNPAALTIATKWNAQGADIISDLENAVALKASWGHSSDDLVCAPNVASTIMANEKVQKYLDNRRITIGEINPKLVGLGVCLLGVLNIGGYPINVFSYNETYIGLDGTPAKYIPDNWCVLATQGMGMRTI